VKFNTNSTCVDAANDDATNRTAPVTAGRVVVHVAVVHPVDTPTSGRHGFTVVVYCTVHPAGATTSADNTGVLVDPRATPACDPDTPVSPGCGNTSYTYAFVIACVPVFATRTRNCTVSPADAVTTPGDGTNAVPAVTFRTIFDNAKPPPGS
jgi:hypothetical protein